MSSTEEEAIARALVERILNGDKKAETEMVERYHTGLINILRNKARQLNHANEIGQETWRIVLEKIHSKQLKDPSKLRYFIISTGKNQQIMYYRKEGIVVIEPLEDDNEDLNMDIEKEIEQKDTIKLVKEVIDKLSKSRDREILHRYYFGEEDKNELCNELELSDLHFNRVLFRARQRFHQKWMQFTGQENK